MLLRQSAGEFRVEGMAAAWCSRVDDGSGWPSALAGRNLTSILEDGIDSDQSGTLALEHAGSGGAVVVAAVGHLRSPNGQLEDS